MQMKYEDMVDKDKAVEFARAYNAVEGAKFNLGSSTFAVFTENSWGDREKKSAENNWKAHISIHPDDLGKAWNLIYPLLLEDAHQFKIVNTTRLKFATDEQKTRLEDAKKDYNVLVANYMGNELSAEALRMKAVLVSTDRSPYSDKIGKAEELYAYVEKKYAEGVVRAKQIVEEGKRMAEGMQITVYMQPGTEKAHQALMGKIEEVLTAENIRPGTIYKTDRPLGVYTSVRHPGADYQEAVTVSSYNPDNAPDNFKELITKQIQDFETQLRNNIGKLKSFKTDDQMSDVAKENVRVKNELGRELEQSLDQFSGQDLKGKIQTLDTFKNGCVEKVKSADAQLKRDDEWKPLLKNLALLFSGIGTIAAVVSLTRRVTTGRYGLFDNKEELFGNTTVPACKETTQQFKEQVQEVRTDEQNPIHTEGQDDTPSSTFGGG